jgi:hypothetical protein
VRRLVARLLTVRALAPPAHWPNPRASCWLAPRGLSPSIRVYAPP